MAALALACTTRAASLHDDPVQVPFESPLDLVLFEAYAVGEEPLRFLLDSGASSCVIDVAAARRGGVELGSSSTTGAAAAGSRVTITQLDYEHRITTLHDPYGYEYAGEGTELALEFPRGYPKLPFLRASLWNGDRVLEDFSISVDSGGRTMGTLGIRDPKVWNAMLTPETHLIEVLGATGLSDTPEGMTHRSFITRMGDFRIEPYVFEDSAVGSEIPLDDARALLSTSGTFRLRVLRDGVERDIELKTSPFL